MNHFIQKVFKKESVVESAGISVVFKILERVVQLFRGIVIARWLGPTEYGVLNLAFFFIPLLVALSKFGIPSCYSRYVPQYEKKNMLIDFLKRNYIVTMGVGLFVTVTVIAFSEQISGLLYTSTEYKFIIILCALTVLPGVLFENLQSSFKGMRVFKVGGLFSFLKIFLFSIIAIILVIYHPKAVSSLSANLIAMLLVTLFFGIVFWKYLSNSNSQKEVIREDDFYNKIFKYSVWFVITPIVYIVFDYIDRLMLNRFLGLHEVGIYSVAMNLSALLFMFGMITGNVLMPNLSNMWEHGEKDKAMSIINLAIKACGLFVLVCAAPMVIFKRHIVLILYGSEYLEGLPLIPILLMFWIFHIIVWIAGVYQLLIEKTHLNLIPIIPGMLLNIALNYILIPRYGTIGAATATTIAYIVLLSILLLVNKKKKMVINAGTIFICISPFILLFNNLLMIISLLVIVIIAAKSEFIFKKEEKAVLIQQKDKLLKKLVIRKQH